MADKRYYAQNEYGTYEVDAKMFTGLTGQPSDLDRKEAASLKVENERLVARVVELEAALRQVVNYAHESHCNYVTLQGVVIYYRHVPETVVNEAAEMVGMSDWKETER